MFGLMGTNMDLAQGRTLIFFLVFRHARLAFELDSLQIICVAGNISLWAVYETGFL